MRDLQQAMEKATQSRRDPPLTTREIGQRLNELALNDPDSPADIVDALNISFEPLTFFPVLLGGLEWQAQVSASIGYSRQEEYSELVQRRTVFSGELVTEPQTRYRTVTDWRPFSQVMTGSVSIDCAAVELPEPLAQALKHFSRDGAFLAAEIPQSARVVNADPIDVVLKRYGKVVFETIRTQVQGWLPGDTRRDLRYSPTYNASGIQTCFIPIWKATVSYQGSELPLIASAINRNDVLFDVPKDIDLVALRAERSQKTMIYVVPGALLAAGILVAIQFGYTTIRTSSMASLGALAMASAISTVLLFRWPSSDRRLTRGIRDRLASNARRRAIAAGVTDNAKIQLQETQAQKSDGMRSIGHVLALVAAASVAAYVLYLFSMAIIATSL